MMRTSIIRAVRPLTIQRTFTTTTRAMAAGDVGSGSSRMGGEKAGDAFTKREKGSEDMWIRQEERAKLLALKERLGQQRKHLDELEGHIDDLVKEQGGGEQN